MRAWISPVFLAAAVTASARAQTIAGRAVQGPSRVPAAGIVAIATDSAMGTVTMTRADSSGTFYLTVPHAGTYGLVFVSGLALPQSAGKVRVASNDFREATYVVTMEREVAFIDKEVDKHAALSPGNKAPLYPDSLRAANVEGEVLMEFVVDSTGRAMPSTYFALRTSDPRFIQAVIDALPAMRFFPAERRGGAVAERVTMPFQFWLSR
jgi:TonB family protein